MSEETLIVVDENDEVVDYQPRSRCHSDPLLMHREIFVLLQDSEDRVYLQKRSKTKEQWPGYWTVTASGHVARGQSYQEAAERELFEEVGVKTKLVPGFKMKIESEINRAIIQVFTGEYVGEFGLDEEEVEEVRGFGKEELVQMKDKLTLGARQCLEMLKLLD